MSKKTFTALTEDSRSSVSVSPSKERNTESIGRRAFDFLNGGVPLTQSADWHSSQKEDSLALTPDNIKNSLLKENLRWSLNG